jgi:serine/threonine protein kinase/tetratricopeptide (TPR) repeat protein
MTPERWQQVKSVLATALEFHDETERARYVADAGGDDTTLRREVESLLAQPDDEFDSVGEKIGLTAAESLGACEGGRQIGNYELVRELGRGGMGAVWLAKRADQQFEKLVAIKLLKRGTDTDEVLRRFQIERQILARLEHPNIARLLDGGITDDGLPYFVMEYVEGQRVTDFCREQLLTIEERLRLFSKICAAVQFAHQNLVVHRDLKPGNILVTADCEPKLLDFGIAKLLTPDDSAIEVTLAEHQRLTPAYASPEQVRGEPITTVSDIYTLGILLYEVLTGQNAHRFSVPHPSPTELLQVVAQLEPVRPSAAATNSSASRRLRGDLDNIILKALRKEPARRYAGVGSFAADIQRHLAHQPVTARKDTVSYRAGKFIRRNKIGTAAAVIVLLTLSGAIIGISWEARRANRRFNDVRQLAHSIVFDYHDAIANLPGSTTVRERLVRDSLKYLDNLAGEGGGDTSFQLEIASAYLKIGDVQGQPYAPNLGDTEGALVSYRRAQTILVALSNARPGNKDVQRQLARTRQKIAQIHMRKAEWEEALQSQQQAVQIIEKLLATDPGNSADRELLAETYLNLGKALYQGSSSPFVAAQRQALEKFRQSLSIREALLVQKPGDTTRLDKVTTSLAYVGYALWAIGKLEGDRQIYREALATFEKAYGIIASAAARPTDARAQRNLLTVLLNLAQTHSLLNDPDSALDTARRALPIAEKLSAVDPGNLEARRDLGETQTGLAKILAETRAVSEALPLCRKSIELEESLLNTDPSSMETRNALVGTYQLLAALLTKMGDSAGALHATQKAEAINAAGPQNHR